MKLAFYSIVLNHHQACVADEFYKLLGSDYVFVETSKCNDSKGAVEDYSNRPYLLKAWKSEECWQKAMNIANTADVCVFGGNESIPFEISRMKRNLLSFDMGERMLKRGWINLISPHLLKKQFVYLRYGWSEKNLYKLCCSAFSKEDLYKLHSFKNKCYKWGYFTQVDEKIDVETSLDVSTPGSTTLMWCSRLLVLKHPELPVQMAARLKEKGYKFHIKMYGDEGNAAKYDKIYSKKRLEELINQLGVEDCVSLMGNRPNNEILDAMRKHDIFLFTSDKNEGWGAVANESLANGCVLVASDEIGSSPYLIRDGENGFMFKSKNVESLTEKVEWLLTHPEDMKKMRKCAVQQMKELWSPHKAAKALLLLIDDLMNHRETSIKNGPCSKA